MTAWLTRSIPDDPGRPRLVARTVRQLQNKINYEIKKLKPKNSEATFKRAHADRSASALLGEDGMGTLLINNTATDVQTADYRLTLIARHLRAKGDERTIDQLRADLAIDLIAGRVAVDASLADLEDEDHGADTDGVVRQLPTSNYARPIIAVTVPIQTLMGISDNPAILSGGTVIPASLARMIAQDPDSTWYRMLTDERGHRVDLSTKGYKPTPPIWRDIVFEFQTCYRRMCDRPATSCEGDHLERWPEGPTTVDNMGPGCKPDHMVKHGTGFGLRRNPDETLTFTTRAGFSHTTERVEQPVTNYWTDVELLESQYSAAEILDAISFLNTERADWVNGPRREMDEDEQWVFDHPAA